MQISDARWLDVNDRKAIGASVIAIVVVIVVVVAAGGIYLATQTGGTTNTTSQGTTGQSTTSSHTTMQTTTQTTGSTEHTTTTQAHTTTTTTTTAVQTTTTTLSTYSCSSTYTSTSTTTGAAQTVQSVLPFFQSLSGMQVQYNGTSNGSSYNVVSSYNVIYASTSGGVTTYKVFISFNDGSSATNATAWVQSNGNVVALDFAGYNETGSMAGAALVGLMTPFTLEANYLGYIQVYTGTFYHSAGTSSVTLGTTTMTVTNYQANSLPETFSECGYTGTLDQFAMSVGTDPGTSFTLVTYLHISGTSDGTTGTFDIRVVSVTKA